MHEDAQRKGFVVMADALGMIETRGFVGMVEAPLFVRPYLNQMTRSELFTLMTCGMATIAGTVMVLYANILQTALPDALGHILIASIISAPAAILVSQLMVPENEQVTEGDMVAPHEMSSDMDAITQGTRDGLGLLLNIVAMLVVLVALVVAFFFIVSVVALPLLSLLPRKPPPGPPKPPPKPTEE